MKINKVLIIRFSSFGDIIQCSGVLLPFKEAFPHAQIDWVTKSEFKNLVQLNDGIKQVWSYSKESGLVGFFRLAFELRSKKYDLIYDAHNNLRSKILFFILQMRLFDRPHWITRSKERWKRILLFNFRINLFPKPFKGIVSFIAPLERFLNTRLKVNFNAPLVHWQFPQELDKRFQDEIIKQATVVIVPFAAWEMKCWPLAHWEQLILKLKDKRIVILGGKGDFKNAERLSNIDRSRVINLAGKLSLIESCQVIANSMLVISADTGLLHVADVLQKKAIALMGPSAFGFTVSPKIKTLEVELSCRPCSKDGSGSCRQKIYQKCMVDMTPDQVYLEIIQMVN